jgi:hypothetical protein
MRDPWTLNESCLIKDRTAEIFPWMHSDHTSGARVRGHRRLACARVGTRDLRAHRVARSRPPTADQAAQFHRALLRLQFFAPRSSNPRRVRVGVGANRCATPALCRSDYAVLNCPIKD